MAPTFIDSTAVAAMLGQSAQQFLRIRRELEDEAGFPLPMPHWRRPLKWRRDQVEGWLAAQGLPQPAMAALPVGANVVLLEAARAAR
jgi:hypothetical protein